MQKTRGKEILKKTINQATNQDIKINNECLQEGLNIKEDLKESTQIDNNDMKK